MILSVDASLNSTGFSVLSDDGHIISVGTIQNAVGGDVAAKLVRICDEVISLAEYHSVSTVVLEDIYIGPNPKTSLLLAKVHGALMLSLASEGIPFVYLTSSKIKSFFKCKRKDEVFKKILSIYPNDTEGWKFSSHNDETDAIAIGLSYIGVA